MYQLVKLLKGVVLYAGVGLCVGDIGASFFCVHTVVSPHKPAITSLKEKYDLLVVLKLRDSLLFCSFLTPWIRDPG